MKSILCVFCLGYVLSGVSGASADPTWARIATSDKRGADISVDLKGGAANQAEQPLLALQQSTPESGTGAKIYLRFDLSSLVNQRVKSAYLTLQPVGDYGFRYDINVFGLHEQFDGSDVTWPEDGGGAGPTWTNAPGNDSAWGGGQFETKKVEEFKEVEKKNKEGEVTIVKRVSGSHQEIVNTGGLKGDAGLHLGMVRARPGSRRCRLIGSKLTGFLNADRDGMVTFVLTLATSADQPILFASSEHVLFDPPSLWITTEGQRSGIAGAEEILSCPSAVGGRVARLDAWYSQMGVKAFQKGWFECGDDAEQIYESVDGRYGRAAVGSSDKAAVALADLMRSEVGFRSEDLARDEWTQSIGAILSQHASRADDLVFAFYALAGDRPSYQEDETAAEFGLAELLNHELPPRARQAIVEILLESSRSPDPEASLSRFRGLIPFAYGVSTHPYIVSQYIKELGGVQGAEAVRSFLDQTISRKMSEPLGQAAAVLRVDYEADPARKSALVDRFMQTNIRDLTDAVRPYHWAARARSGQLLPSLVKDEPALARDQESGQAAGLGIWGEEIVETIFRAGERSETSTLGIMIDSARLDLGDLDSPSELCAGLVEQLYAEGNYLEASSVALGLIKKRGARVHGLSLGSFSTTLADWIFEDTSESRQAVAALLLHVIYRQNLEEGLSRKYLNEAASLSTTKQTRAVVLFHQALVEAQEGERAEAKRLSEDAASASPRSTAVVELRDLLVNERGE